MSPERKLCLVFDSDSQYFACLNLVEPFREKGWSITLLALANYKPPAETIPPETGWAETEFVESIPFLETILAHDAIGAYLPGSRLRRLHAVVSDHFTAHGRRPILFTGYNGVVLVKFEEGMGWRLGYDFIALNSPEDAEKSRQFMRHCSTPRAVPIPIIGIDRKRRGIPWRPTHDPAWQDQKRLIFAEQVLFPKSDAEKNYVYSHLLRIALENPDWEIIIKPRTLPDGTTFHRQSRHISRFLQKNYNFPPNLVVSYENLDQQMAASTALLSISSTAFFDAIGSGLPGFILSDFGISNTYGTHFFHGSGCSLCLAEITTLNHNLFNRRPTDEWLEYKGFDPKFTITEFAEVIEAGIARGINQTPLPLSEIEQRVLGVVPTLPPANRKRQLLTWRRLKKSTIRGWKRLRNSWQANGDLPQPSVPQLPPAE